jgi:hypothetical protein
MSREGLVSGMCGVFRVFALLCAFVFQRNANGEGRGSWLWLLGTWEVVEAALGRTGGVSGCFFPLILSLVLLGNSSVLQRTQCQSGRVASPPLQDVRLIFISIENTLLSLRCYLSRWTKIYI